MGVITKPDRLPAGSGSEAKFIELARNEDVFFKLGWHVIKNRAFEERELSFEDRNLSEKKFFSSSNFRCLPTENVGIDALRIKLSQLLFDHVKSELPRLQSDLDNALRAAREGLEKLGESRSTVAECREFLAKLNMSCYELCKAGVGGNYVQDWFQIEADNNFLEGYAIPKKRIRALVQFLNHEFTNEFREKGNKYKIDLTNPKSSKPVERRPKAARKALDEQKQFTKGDALNWVREMLHSCRGTELVGNFNPNLVAELFWEQSERWEKLARIHIERIYNLCSSFLYHPDRCNGAQ